MKRFMIVCLLVLLTGCARQVVWLPKDLNGVNAERANRQCLRESESLPRTGIDWGFSSAKYWNECMEKQGFRKTYIRPPIL